MSEGKETLAQEVCKIAYNIRLDKPERDGRGHFPELGLCNRCSNLKSIVMEYGAKAAACTHSVARLNGRQRVRQCSEFWASSYMGIHSLLEMNPIFIEPDKNKAGF